MSVEAIVDTNVAIVANGHAEHVGVDCQLACVQQLILIQRGQRVCIDHSGLILSEYRRYLSHSGQPGLGDAFFKWLWDNQANIYVCDQVTITPTNDGEQLFAEFPDDPALARFDPSDRKFVAVARAHPAHPPIHNAVDTDWYQYQEALAAHGVVIIQVCPDDLRRLADRQ